MPHNIHTCPVTKSGLADILEGEMTVELKTGETKHLKAGDAEVEVMNTLHNGKNTGASTLKMLPDVINAPKALIKKVFIALSGRLLSPSQIVQSLIGD